MLNKYNELLEMLEKEEYIVDRFECNEQYEAYVSDNNYTIGIYLEDDAIEVYVHDDDDDDEECLESKKYLNIKFAYNFIKRYLED